MIAAAGPARPHEARQGPISTLPISLGPGPVTPHTSTTSSTPTTTMSPTSSSEPSLPSSSTHSPIPSSASSSSPDPVSSSLSPSDTSLTASPSSTETSSATPSPSPSGITFTVPNMTTCTSGLISWNYSGAAAELSLSITNIDLNYASSRIHARQNTVNSSVQQLLAVTNTSAQSWMWPSVNVTQGWYEIVGEVSSSPAVDGSSSQFFITNGTDVTCLTGTSPQTTPSPSTSALSASNNNLGRIVGGVVGGVVGVLLVIIAGLCMWRRKRRFVTRGGGIRDRKWDSLKSTNSSLQPGGNETQVSNTHFHAHSESTGAILQDEAGGKAFASATPTPGGSDEDVATTGEEKLVSPVSSAQMSPVDAPNTPIPQDRRVSMYSVQTPTTPATNEVAWCRSTSRHISNQSLEQQAQRIRSSMETSMRRSERLSMPTLPPPSLSRISHSPTHSKPKEEYPLSPIAATPVNRSVSTSAVSMTTRRASRKPVPHYDPSLLLEDTNADSVSTFTGGAESSQSHGTGTLTGAHGTPPDKATFGDGRPVHYLIPDMPPPQQD